MSYAYLYYSPIPTFITYALQAKHSHIAELSVGKGSKALLAFINGIPDSKLKGIAESPHTIYQDTDFRLDMHTSIGYFNIFDGVSYNECRLYLPNAY